MFIRQLGTGSHLKVAAFLIGAWPTISPGVASAEEASVVPVIEVNDAQAALGKRLFFDPRLSGNADLSCSSCHIPENGFSDGQALSDAYPGSLGFRNVPTLINTGHRNAWLHDSRLGTNLNDVTREMITETYIMNMDMRLMQERLKQDPVYVEMFEAAGFGEPSNGGVRNAIPAYLNTLISRNSPYDNGEMSESAIRGQELFNGKGSCNTCHTGNRFTDDLTHNIGVPENYEIFKDADRHVTFVTFAKFMGIENYMNIRRDVGAHILTHKSDGSDVGKFLTPTLRELGQTAPYMHNGIMATLEVVVAFYNSGGGDDPNKDMRLQPLGLSPQEQTDLVAFLKALTGDALTGSEFTLAEEIDTDSPAISDWRTTEN